MEEYGRRNKNPATGSQNKPETRNATTRVDNHSCRRRSSGSGGEGHTSEDHTNDRALKEGRGSINSNIFYRDIIAAWLARQSRAKPNTCTGELRDRLGPRPL